MLCSCFARDRLNVVGLINSNSPTAKFISKKLLYNRASCVICSGISVCSFVLASPALADRVATEHTEGPKKWEFTLSVLVILNRVLLNGVLATRLSSKLYKVSNKTFCMSAMSLQTRNPNDNVIDRCFLLMRRYESFCHSAVRPIARLSSSIIHNFYCATQLC